MILKIILTVVVVVAFDALAGWFIVTNPATWVLALLLAFLITILGLRTLNGGDL